MEYRLRGFIALLAVAVFGSACGTGEIGAGGGPSDPSNGDARVGPFAVDDGGVGQSEPTPPPAEPAPPPVPPGDLDQPWTHNTGPSDPAALVPSGTLKITTDGALVENVDVKGRIVIEADNVTVRNFRVSGGYYAIQATEGHTGIVLEDGEVTSGTEPDGSCIYGGGFTARRLYVHDCAGDGFKTLSNTIVEYSFVEKLGLNGRHTDGNQTVTGSNITFRYNTIFMPINNAPYSSNATFMLEESVSNFVINGNWLNGGNHTINTSNITSSVGVSITNNKFGRDYRFGLTNGPTPVWTNNTWEDTGVVIP